MSNATEKAAIANIALLAVGQSTITLLTESTPTANKVSLIFENVVKELLDDDWFFNRKRVKLEDLVKIHKLAVDTAPSPASFKVGATITGVTSSVTCTVVERLSDTVYLVTEPSDDWTDGEVLGDGTNTVDCETGYPLDSELLDYGSWDYGYIIPSDKLYFRGVGGLDYDKIKYPHQPENNRVFTNITDAWLHYNKWIGEAESTTASDVTLMPPWFHRLISARIAHILSPNITENQKIRSKVDLEYREAYLIAKEKNGEECYHESENQGNNDWAEGANRELGTI